VKSIVDTLVLLGPKGREKRGGGDGRRRRRRRVY
jgi:hypothetical protein